MSDRRWFTTLFLLCAVAASTFSAWGPDDPAPITGPATTSTTIEFQGCPEDAVRLVGPEMPGTCFPADDFLEGSASRAAATAMTATCPTGHGVVEVTPEDTVAWCAP